MPNILSSYRDNLKKWQDHAGDLVIQRITAQDIRAYLTWLRDGYKPHSLTGGDRAIRP